jgi:hypothetical protein
MSKIIAELFSSMMRDLLMEGAQSAFMKVGRWLDKKLDGPTINVTIGMVLGFAAIAFVVVVAGLIGA